MSRAWWNDGQLMLDENGILIVCENCPCGCEYCKTIRLTLSEPLEISPKSNCCGSGISPPSYIFSGYYDIPILGTWTEFISDISGVTFEAEIASITESRVSLAVKWTPGGCTTPSDAAFIIFDGSSCNDRYINYSTTAICNDFTVPSEFYIDSECIEYNPVSYLESRSLNINKSITYIDEKENNNKIKYNCIFMEDTGKIANHKRPCMGNWIKCKNKNCPMDEYFSGYCTPDKCKFFTK